MSSRSVLTWSVVSMMILLVTCDNTTIHVKPDKPQHSSQPCPEPCISLFINASQLSDLLTSNTILKLQPGVHSIGQNIVVRNKTNVSLIGDVQGTADVVHIACSEHVSISFVNCSDVIVKDIIFEHCGDILDTSYMNTAIGENYWYQFEYRVLQSALIFVHCTSTTLDNLIITKSPGFGVLGVNMLGNTTVQSISIESSGLPNTCFLSYSVSGPSLGGGILLLFQNTPNGSSNVSNFRLSDSRFLSSCSAFSSINLVPSSGVSAIFGQNMYSLNMIIENSTFINNTVNCLNFIYSTGVSKTKLFINNCIFRDNRIHPVGDLAYSGVVAINYAIPISDLVYLIPEASFTPLPLKLHIPNEVLITDCVFTNNTSYQSSGISFISYSEDYMLKICLKNINFTKNAGYFSSSLVFLQQESNPVVLQVTIENCTFVSNSLFIPEELYVGDQINFFRYASVVAFHNVRYTNFTGSALFEKNNGTSVYLYSSTISLNGSFEFIQNYANIGAGLGLYANSYLLVHEGTNISFINNVARRRGGAIYVEQIQSIPSAFGITCFIQYLSPEDHFYYTRNISVHIYFANNSANEAGNSVYTSQIYSCSWLHNIVFPDMPYTQGTGRISFADPNKQQISSDPNQVCFCSQPWPPKEGIVTACKNKLYETKVYPGETIDIMVIGVRIYEYYRVDRVYGTAPTIIHTTVMAKSNCSINGLKQVVHEVPNYCTTLRYAVSSNSSSSCSLQLRTDFQVNATVVVLETLECPFSFSNKNGICDCHQFLESAKVTNCNLTSQTFRRPGNSWLYTVNNSGTLTEILARNYCDYCNTSDSDLSPTDLDSQCLYKRSGKLCGQCQCGYSSVFGSPQCKICSNAWVSLLIAFAIAGIILVIIIFVLNFTITTGTINGIIFYANIISINGTILFPTSNTFHPPLLVFISFLNLDLGIETCFYDGMDEYAKIWLEYVFPVYLIVIVAVIIVMARYTTWARRAVQGNGVPVLSTLLFLSYTKLLRNSSVVLFYIADITHMPSKDVEIVWRVDANVEYFGYKFTILFIVSLLIFLLIVIPFTMVMLFTKTFLRFKYVSHFKPMLDAYQSTFANPFRFWLGWRLLIRAFLFSTSALDTQTVLLINSTTLCGLAIMQAYFRPFNSFYCNLWDISFLLNLATLFTVSQYFGEANDIMVTVLVGISFVQFGALICYHVIKAFDRYRKEPIQNLKMFHKMNTLLQWIHTALVNSDIYKHLAVPKEPERQKPIRRSSDDYSEMIEPLVMLEGDM